MKAPAKLALLAAMSAMGDAAAPGRKTKDRQAARASAKNTDAKRKAKRRAAKQARKRNRR